MTAIPLDDDLKAKLGKLDRPVEVKDERGRVVGTFVPQRKYEHLMAWWAFDVPLPPDDGRPPVPVAEINAMLLERIKR